MCVIGFVLPATFAATQEYFILCHCTYPSLVIAYNDADFLFIYSHMDACFPLETKIW